MTRTATACRRRAGQATENYTYDAGDKLTAITGGVDPRTFTYDAAGRTTAILRGSGTTSFAYDYESRVTSITRPGSLVDSFTYNGLDARVGQSGASGSKTFKRSGITPTSPLLSDGSAQYTPGISERRGAITKYDHHGLKNAMRQNQHGGVFTAYKLTDAFGHETLWSGGTWSGPHQYGGQFGYQTDSDNLRLLGHRYYDASTGRFLTRDPIKSGRNWYGYCGNDPVSFSDATGFFKVIIIGDTSGVPGGGELGGLVIPKPGKEDFYFVKGKHTKEDILAAMVFADEFYFYGHGTPQGTLLVDDDITITNEDIEAVAIMRAYLGIGLMKRAVARSCWSARQSRSVNIC